MTAPASRDRKRPRQPPHRKPPKPLPVHPPDFPGEYNVGGTAASKRPVVFFGSGGGHRNIRKPETLT